ncbi:hypothetical protein Misp06_00984 [Microbulbifer sp. NBRC 101763]|nr:hypothetical protein [Microbulbifer sp. MLAF003]WHI49273.1 hypothetical protein P3339_12325 [Microbulbifer sp. MLAF003]
MTKHSFLLTVVLIALVFVRFETSAEEDNLNSIKSGKGIICSNEYVLCTSAPCIPDPRNPDSNAICRCDVNKGLNFGLSECKTRIPATNSNGVKKALSTFSFAQAPTKPVLSCPEGKPWTDCLDQPCIVDPMNPLKAICTCKIVRDKPFVTFGGDCVSLTCDTGYWSGATAESYLEASRQLMKAVDLDEMPAKYCVGRPPEI